MAKSFTISMILQMVNKISGPAAAAVGALNKLDEASKRAQKNLMKMSEGLIKTGKEMKGGLFSLAAITAPLAGIMMYTASYETGIAKLATMTKKSAAATEKQWGATFRKIAKDTGVALESIPEHAYQFLSGGGTEDQLEGYIRRQREMAKAAFMTMEQAVDLGTSVKNAYGDSVKNLGNMIMATQDVGKITGGQIAPEVSKVMDLAKEVGLKAEEVFAMWAAGSTTGATPEMISTRMRGLFTAIGGSGSEQLEIYKKIGVSLNADMINRYGQIKSLKIFDQAMRSNYKTQSEYLRALKQALGSEEARAMYLRLLSESGSEKYQEAMQKMTSSTDLVTQATRNMGKTLHEETAKTKESFKVLMLDLGTKLMPMVSEAVTGLGSFISTVTEVVSGNEALQDALLGIAGAVAGVILAVKLAGALMWGFGYATQFAAGAMWLFSSIFAVLKAAVVSFGAAMQVLWGPVGLIAVGILAVILITILLIKHWDKVKKVAIKVASAIKEGFLTAMSAIGSAADAMLFPVFNLFKKIGIAIGEAAVAGANFAAGLAVSIGSGFMDLLRTIGAFFSSIGSAAWNAGKEAAQAFVNGFKSIGSTILNKLGFGGGDLNIGDITRQFAPAGVPSAVRPVGNTVSVNMSGITVVANNPKEFTAKAWDTVKPTFEDNLNKTSRDVSRRSMGDK